MRTVLIVLAVVWGVELLWLGALAVRAVVRAHGYAVDMSVDGGVLRILTARGAAPVLVEPIPAIACLPLPYLTASAVREYIIVSAFDEVEICEHQFHITAWQVEPAPGLVLVHHCCQAPA